MTERRLRAVEGEKRKRGEWWARTDFFGFGRRRSEKTEQVRFRLPTSLLRQVQVIVEGRYVPEFQTRTDLYVEAVERLVGLVTTKVMNQERQAQVLERERWLRKVAQRNEQLRETEEALDLLKKTLQDYERYRMFKPIEEAVLELKQYSDTLEEGELKERAEALTKEYLRKAKP